MWTKIDEFEEDNGGDRFRTYASTVGSIGCLVMVVGNTGSSTTFVPGVKLEQQGQKTMLVPAAGYGEVPQRFEES